MLVIVYCFTDLVVMISRHHWEYYNALEEDVQRLTRFIHFAEANLNTYSIELARLLMASTQEIDVLFKQICAKHGDSSTTEPGYRAFFSKGDYAKICDIKTVCYRYNLRFTPFAEWKTKTPRWWTANNKIKHQRGTDFQQASLGNVLTSLSALLIANIYFVNETGDISKEHFSLTLLRPENMVKGAAAFPNVFSFKMP